MSWLIVPLQYLFLRWKAENLQAKASSAKDARRHDRALRAAVSATETAEIMQIRFPAVTHRIDTWRRRDVVQESYSA